MIKNLLESDETPEPDERPKKNRPVVIGLFGDDEPDTAEPPKPAFLPGKDPQIPPPTEAHFEQAPPPAERPSYTPPSGPETVRMSGLAWSAGIVLGGSIVFMLIVGWFADLLLGSSPWGIVAGIVVGAVIGFTQLFRINREIFKAVEKRHETSLFGSTGERDVTHQPANEPKDDDRSDAPDDNLPR